MPIKIAIESPIGDHNEYLPPTQSDMVNILSVLIPNLLTASLLLEIATKCFLIASSFPSLSTNHFLDEKAFVMVS